MKKFISQVEGAGVLSKKVMVVRMAIAVLVIGLLVTAGLSFKAASGEKKVDFSNAATTTNILYPNYAALNPEVNRNSGGSFKDAVQRDTNGQSSSVMAEGLVEGELIDMANTKGFKDFYVGMENPQKPGYIFKGWFCAHLRRVFDATADIYDAQMSGYWSGFAGIWEFDPGFKVVVNNKEMGKARVVTLQNNEAYTLPAAFSDIKVTSGLESGVISKTYKFKGWYTNKNFNATTKINDLSIVNDKCVDASFTYVYNKTAHTVDILSTSGTKEATVSLLENVYAKWDVVIKKGNTNNGSNNGSNQNTGGSQTGGNEGQGNGNDSSINAGSSDHGKTITVDIKSLIKKLKNQVTLKEKAINAKKNAENTNSSFSGKNGQANTSKTNQSYYQVNYILGLIILAAIAILGFMVLYTLIKRKKNTK